MNDDNIVINDNNKKKNIIKVILITLSILILLFLIIYFFVIRVKDNNEYLSVNIISKNVNVGSSFNIIARVENNNNPKLEWISNSESCSVNNGIVTGNKKGTCVISVKYKNQEKKVNVYVIDPNSRDQITEFKLVSKSSFDMFVNEVSNIIISIKPDYMLGSVKYSSSDNNICSVDYNGVIKALKSGKCVISCSVDGYNGKLSINVNVKGESYSGEPSIEPEPLPPTPTPSDPEPEPIKPEPDPGENPTPTPTPTPTPEPTPSFKSKFVTSGTFNNNKCLFDRIEDAKSSKGCKPSEIYIEFVPDDLNNYYDFIYQGIGDGYKTTEYFYEEWNKANWNICLADPSDKCFESYLVRGKQTRRMSGDSSAYINNNGYAIWYACVEFFEQLYSNSPITIKDTICKFFKIV